jgi:hypothetical protein
LVLTSPHILHIYIFNTKFMQSTKQKRNSLGHFSISLWTYFQIINKTKFLIIQISSDLFFLLFVLLLKQEHYLPKKSHNY